MPGSPRQNAVQRSMIARQPPVITRVVGEISLRRFRKRILSFGSGPAVGSSGIRMRGGGLTEPHALYQECVCIHVHLLSCLRFKWNNVQER